MNEKHTKELNKRFKFLKRGKELSPYDMFGIEVHDGWFELVWNLCLDIEKELKANPKIAKEFIVLQIKEKFGGLRFYCGPTTEKMSTLVDAAEDLSLKTCEDCGKPGTAHKLNGWWYVTKCPKCAKKAEAVAVKKKDDEVV